MAAIRTIATAKPIRAQGIVVIAEQRRAVAGIAGHDVQQHLARRKSNARGGGQQRQGVVAGARSKADVQDRADREHRELDALQQAQRAGQFVQQELRGKRRRQHQRHGVEAERVEGDGQ